MQCAKCHHHPFEKWSQDDYYGMAAFFVRLGTKTSQEFGLFGRESVIFLSSTGESTHPRKGGVVKPHPLDGPVMDDPFDRRRKLAEWLTAKDNPFFARNIVNRFWGYLMGRGLVEPLDDMRATNPASNPELLDALADGLRRAQVRPEAPAADDPEFAGLSAQLARRRPAIAMTRVQRPLHALHGQAADGGADWPTRSTSPPATREKYAGLPLGTRAIQLPDTEVRSFLLDVFGRPPRQITCECERTTQPNIAQALHLLNGDFLNKKIADPKGRIETLFKAKKTHEQIIEELYLVTLSPATASRRKSKKWETLAARGGIAEGRLAGLAVGAAELARVFVQSLNLPVDTATPRDRRKAQGMTHAAPIFRRHVGVCRCLCGVTLFKPAPVSRPTGRTSARSCASIAPPATTPRT